MSRATQSTLRPCIEQASPDAARDAERQSWEGSGENVDIGPSEAMPADSSARTWVLKRNCSLTPRQVLRMLACVTSLQALLGATSLWLGYTWVALFTLVEALALIFSFWIYAVHATDSETLTLSHGRLVIRSCNGRKLAERVWPATWVRVLPRHEGDLVALRALGQTIVVGRHLRRSRRTWLASELEAAIARCSRAPGDVST